MAQTSLSEIFEDVWESIGQHVKNAMLFMDESSAECLHWYGGLNRLTNRGALGVRNFSMSERANIGLMKAVFFLSSPFNDEVCHTLMAIVKCSNFRNCTVFTSVPPHCHSSETSESSQSFQIMEKKLLSWMDNLNCSSKVLHLPILGICLSSNIFILPSFSQRFCPISTEFKLFQALKNAPEHGLKSLPMEMQMNVKMLASSLNSLLESFEAKGEIFSLGPLSHIVGTELENTSQLSRKKAFPHKASVLLLDRSLDLAGPLSQTIDTAFGKLLRVFPHLPGHVCDVDVPMNDLASCISGNVFGLPLLASGCIGHRNSPTEVDVLNTLLTSRIKEAVVEINRKLVQLSVTEGLPVDNSFQSPPKTVKKLASLYKSNHTLLKEHCGLLQQALAAVQVIEHPMNTYLENLLGAEKLLVQNLSLSRSGAGHDIDNLISGYKKRGYKLVDVLTIIAYLYALYGGDVLTEEAKSSVQATLIEALLQDEPEITELVKNIAGEDPDDQEVTSAVKVFFQLLKRMGTLRKNLKKYRSIFEAGDLALPAVYIPLLKQVLKDIFSSPEMSALEYHSSGLRDLITTGFRLFMNVTKPQPKDNPLLVIVILGGITDSEINMISDVVKHQKSTKILVGSTTLLTPSDVMTDLFSVVKNLSYSSTLFEE